MNQYKILVLDDEPVVGERLKPSLEKEGFLVETFTQPAEALKRLESEDFDIVVTDIRMSNIDGIQILETVQNRSLRTKVIMITGYATLETARESMAKGAFDFIAKPFKLGEIRKTIRSAVEVLNQDNSFEHTAEQAPMDAV